MTLVEELARGLFENDARPDKVIFTTYNERKDGTKRIGMDFSARPGSMPN